MIMLQIPPRKNIYPNVYLANALLIVLLGSFTHGFNVETSAAKYIQNPMPSKNTSDYFGFSFAFGFTDSKLRSVIGSPKARKSTDGFNGFALTLNKNSDEKSGSGAIYSCLLSLADVNASCMLIEPFKTNSTENPKLIVDRESLGMSMTSNPDLNTIATCSPLRMRECSYSFITSGTCSTTKDFGQNWRLQTKQSNLNILCPISTMDLIFVLDGSFSVDEFGDGLNFDRVKNWVKTVAAAFYSSAFTDVGVIQFSHAFENRSLEDQQYIVTEIQLGRYKDKETFEGAVDQITFQGFTTFTATAINKTVLDFKQSSRFADESNKKVMVLLTDGKSTDSSHLAASASYARSLGIAIYAIGVANYVETELLTITGTPERVFTLKNFSQLTEIVGSLQLSIAEVLEGESYVNSTSTNKLRQAEIGFASTLSAVSKGESNACRTK